MAAQPKLHRERHSRIERLFINIKQVIDVFCVNSVRPTIAELLLTGASREFKPAFVQEIAKLVRTHHPNHDRRDIRHRSEPSFAFGK